MWTGQSSISLEDSGVTSMPVAAWALKITWRCVESYIRRPPRRELRNHHLAVSHPERDPHPTDRRSIIHQPVTVLFYTSPNPQHAPPPPSQSSRWPPPGRGGGSERWAAPHCSRGGCSPRSMGEGDRREGEHATEDGFGAERPGGGSTGRNSRHGGATVDRLFVYEPQSDIYEARK